MRKDLSIHLIIPVIFLLVITASSIHAEEEYLYIDMTDVTIGETRGVEPSPFHLSRDILSGEYFISIKTLNSLHGAQLGTTLKLSLPPDDQSPAAILWSKHFMPNITRGVEPSPFIVMSDYTMYHFPLTYELDGTPITAGEWETISLPQTPAMFGEATCATELPGVAFSDGLPRLYVGTEDGYIFWLVDSPFGGLVVEGAFTYSGGPILDLEPIPQHGYIALGALMDNAIYGFVPGTKKGSSESRYMYNFRLFDPRIPPMTDFDVIGPKDLLLTDPMDELKIVIADGTVELAIATLQAELLGDITMTIIPDVVDGNTGKIATNALLRLPTDHSTVLYDPHFNGEDGSSGCALELIGYPPDPCHYICGDVDNEGNINILDIVYLINYKYKSGLEPYILRLGDVDGIDPINILDIVFLINYKYKSGPEPNCP